MVDVKTACQLDVSQTRIAKLFSLAVVARYLPSGDHVAMVKPDCLCSSSDSPGLVPPIENMA